MTSSFRHRGNNWPRQHGGKRWRKEWRAAANQSVPKIFNGEGANDAAGEGDILIVYCARTFGNECAARCHESEGLPGTKLPCTISLYAHHPSWIFGRFGCAVRRRNTGTGTSVTPIRPLRPEKQHIKRGNFFFTTIAKLLYRWWQTGGKQGLQLELDLCRTHTYTQTHTHTPWWGYSLGMNVGWGRRKEAPDQSKRRLSTRWRSKRSQLGEPVVNQNYPSCLWDNALSFFLFLNTITFSSPPCLCFAKRPSGVIQEGVGSSGMKGPEERIILGWNKRLHPVSFRRVLCLPFFRVNELDVNELEVNVSPLQLR